MGDPIINTQVDDINTTLGNIKVDLAALRPSIRAIKDAIAETYLTETIENVPIASFSDGADEIPLRELQVAINPIQSLNGQTSPYPAGGGKNKLEPRNIAQLKSLNTSGTWNGDVYTANGVTFTPVVNNYGYVNEIKTSGTASANANFYVGRTDAAPYAGMVLNGAPSGGAGKWEIDFSLQASPYSGWAYDTGSGATINASASGMSILYIVIKSGKDASGLTFRPMIRLATDTDPTYAPYSNICPISGHTECEVTRTGKNWVDTAGRTVTTTSYPANLKRIRTENCSATKSGDTLVCTDFGAWAKVRYGITGSLVVGQEYTISAHFQNPNGRTLVIGVLRGNGWATSPSSTATSVDMKYTFVYDGEAEFGLMVSNSASAQTGTVTISNIQIELGSTATAYEPFAGARYVFSLGQTVYGGTLNVTTGVLTIDRAMVDLGTLDWTAFGSIATYGGLFYSDSIKSAIKHNSDNEIYCACSMFVSVPNSRNGWIGQSNEMPNNSVRVRTSDGRLYLRADSHIGETGADFKTAMSGVQLCYELATPTTVQLTAAEVETLFGQNNVWCSSGNIIKLTYRKAWEIALAEGE